MVQLLAIHFVGPRGEMDQMAKDTWGTTTLLARPLVLYQWILILQKTTEWYAQVVIPEYHELARRIAAVNRDIVTNAVKSCTDMEL
jgi:hypothetical protein